ncbi:MAG: 50S ribosomal protein L18 [Flavobacteriales bacterium]|nr:50S ribosomal protein L18 [Bacteroidota bacterium]MCB9241130.1 50S ribosomal protein L18 [Flavobacteriales bacterium]
MSNAKVQRRLKVKRRVRKNITGTATKPRLSVFRSNKQIYGQLIDDQAQRTLVAHSSAVTEAAAGTKVEQSFQAGKALAEKAVANGIEEVVFDRNGYLYHGRIKSFAEGAREGGLKF